MQKSPPLDFLLQQRAVSQGKTVIGLEEMSEQVSVFERMSLPDQIQMLSAMVRYQENLEGLTEQLIAAYRDRDLARLGRLMEAIERDHAGVRIFSLPSVDHPQYGRHIELGVKGEAGAIESAYAALKRGLAALGVPLGPELVR